ncbi:peroxiredoxin-like family protein [Lutibacter maritimus]|uniref:thioredoxin-dependent peroxiredoxin n=1 Tax=Lutibacter maritimus TaxID=593133 RepID=A0A1I6RXU8_9FLAO|nr:peroxiredoxin-like family protein [Lutibacter maritimus]SFS69496.1 Peroxiredoxin [Lutibacter maritimus]
MKKQFILLALVSVIGFQSNAQIADKAVDISPLLIGEVFPNILLKSQDASEHFTLNILSKKPTIILFYRGGWCPYCNAHLAEIQEAESEILELGYQIVAISPDTPENLKITDNKNKINYGLYSDSDGELIKAVGIAFKSPEKYGKMLSVKSGGLNEGFLPVPAVFIVDTSGKILFEYINPDYKTRLSASLLIAVLKNLGIKK